MDKSVSITLIIVVGILVLAGIGYAIFSSNTIPQNTVTGNGQATIQVTPDLVKVYFSVDTLGATSEEAKNKNSEIVDEFITAILKEGFERKDIQTQGFNIYPEYDYSKPDYVNKIKGYRATHSIVVEMSSDDSDKIGTVIDAGVDAGAGISYINFELSPEKQNQYKADAIKMAAEDAQLKAQALASGLDKEIGELLSVTQSDFGYTPWGIYRSDSGAGDVAMAKEATTNIQPSDQSVSASVTAVFELK